MQCSVCSTSACMLHCYSPTVSCQSDVLLFTVERVASLSRSAVMQDGLIVNIGSIAGLEPMKSTPVYAASKWGLRGWSLSNYEVGLPQPG